MRKFKILQPIVLGFLTARESYDSLVGPDAGCVLGYDGKSIWAITRDAKQESHTITGAIKIWLQQRKIEELHGPLVVDK